MFDTQIFFCRIYSALNSSIYFTGIGQCDCLALCTVSGDTHEGLGYNIRVLVGLNES